MQIAFRTDASLDAGTGHVMRCLTLAEALRAQGASCRFISREHRGHVMGVIRERGFDVRALPAAALAQSATSHADWLSTDWNTDAQQTAAALGDGEIDWLVVDHYALDAQWERTLRRSCRHVAVIDDLADRAHDCDLLLDQNLGRAATDYANLVPAGCQVLAGAEYALLRSEFAALRDHSLARRQGGQLKHILIAMGGVDKDNVTACILDALAVCPLDTDARITVVLGPSAPWLEQIKSQVAGMPRPTQVEVNVSNMAELMAESDVAIGAAGTTAWERCCLGLPSLVMVLAANQQPGASALAAANAALLIKGGGNLPLELAEKLAKLRDHQALAAMQAACTGVTSGWGASKLAAQILGGGHA